MKRFGFSLLLLGLLWMIWREHTISHVILSPSSSPSSTPSATVKPPFGLVEGEDQFVRLKLEHGFVRVAYSEINQPYQVHVGINPLLASSSASLRDAYNCTLLTNAGFYDKSGQPMGLLIDRQHILSPWKKNHLFDGVVGYDLHSRRVVVEQGEPSHVYEWAIQAGPLLWLNDTAVVIDQKNDQAARRMIAIVTDRGELIIGTVVADDSLFGGPQLYQMAEILSVWQQHLGKHFRAVLNLDGGTASAFLSSQVKLKELKPIGSYLCVQ